MTIKLTPAQARYIKTLADTGKPPVAGGRGRPVKVQALRDAGLVEYRTAGDTALSNVALTTSGRAAAAELAA